MAGRTSCLRTGDSDDVQWSLGKCRGLRPLWSHCAALLRAARAVCLSFCLLLKHQKNATFCWRTRKQRGIGQARILTFVVLMSQFSELSYDSNVELAVAVLLEVVLLDLLLDLLVSQYLSQYREAGPRSFASADRGYRPG